MTKSKKLGLEIANQNLDVSPQLANQQDSGKVEVAKYVGGDVSYHIHVLSRNRLVGIDSQYLCIEIGRIGVNRLLAEIAIQHPGLNDTLEYVSHSVRRTYSAWRDSHFYNLPVLVGVGELPDSDKRIYRLLENKYLVPSIVWLKQLDFCPLFCTYLVENLPAHLPFPIIEGIANWELDFLGSFDPVSRMFDSEGVGQIIERRAQIVDGIPNNKPKPLEIFEKPVNVYVEVKDVLRSIGIEIVSDRYCVKGVSFENFERINMFSAPVMFPPDVIEGMVACYHQRMASSKKDTKKKPSQKTEKGYEIPVPSEKDFFDALEKASKPVKKDKKKESDDSDSSSGSEKSKDKE